MYAERTPGKIFDRKTYSSRPAGRPKERSTDKGQRDVRKTATDRRMERRGIRPDNTGGQDMELGRQAIAVIVVVAVVVVVVAAVVAVVVAAGVLVVVVV
jgi:Flp pilus assembly protein TadB